MDTRILQLQWKEFENFFELWRYHREAAQLVYVIGSAHHCYVGSIGSRGGVKGLAMRYQWQYLQRAKAIFGLDEADGQTAFSATMSGSSIEPQDILAAEAFVQHSLIQRVGTERALFEPEELVEEITFTNSGEIPEFLNAL